MKMRCRVPFIRIIVVTCLGVLRWTVCEAIHLHELSDSTTGDGRQGADSFVRFTRQGNFIRIGRPSGFVRIGKMDHEGSDKRVPDLSSLPTTQSSEFSREARYPLMSRFIRIGRNNRQDYPREWLANRANRLSSPDRMGLNADNKRSSGFVRIGKSYPDMFDTKRASGFVRIGKTISDTNEKRTPRFVRIGKMHTNQRYDKRTSGFVRIGKSDQDKKSSGFVRIGKSMGGPKFDKKSSGFVRIGKDHFLKRPSGFVRIGKAFGDGGYDLDSGFRLREPGLERKRASGFVRIGKSPEVIDTDQLADKRASGFVRIGKSDSGVFNHESRNNDDDVKKEEGKRSSSFVRFGKSDIEMMPKKASSFVRIGKQDSFGGGADLEEPYPYRGMKPEGRLLLSEHADPLKRTSGFVRIGKSASKNDEISKRPSSFVRIGKNVLQSTQDSVDPQEIKKSSGFVRIGKQLPTEESSTLLSQTSSTSGERAKRPMGISTRASAFVRIGKIPSVAFVPVGQDVGRVFEVPTGRRVGYRRRSRNGQFSFVRIG